MAAGVLCYVASPLDPHREDGQLERGPYTMSTTLFTTSRPGELEASYDMGAHVRFSQFTIK